MDRGRWTFILLAISGVVLLIALATWVLTSTGGAKSSPGTAAPAIATTASPSPSTTASPRAKHQRATGTPGSTTTDGSLPGKPGWGWGYTDTPHHMVLQVTSGSPVFAYLGWKAPTAKPNGGIAKMYASTWTKTMTVYGAPHFVTFYVQFGPSNGPVTCSVTVDGRRLVTKSAKGPYGAVMCIG